MAKAYTDIEQSRKLAKILPLKSADMFYFCSPFDEEYFKNPRFGVAEHNTNEIPCWSLAALLKVITRPKLWEMKGEWYATSQLGCFSKGHDNPIDACVEILIKEERINYNALYELCQEKCKGCKYGVTPFRFPKQYSCKLNKNQIHELPISDEFRCIGNPANPTMCNGGTTEYEF